MKIIHTIISIAFFFVILSANGQSKFIDGAATSMVKLNIIGVNSNELQFEMGANGSFIKWQTSNENNTSHFELQVSNDNNNFETIRIVAAGGVTEWTTSYHSKFIRNYLSAEKVYYRLKTVFSDGTEAITQATIFQISGAITNYANVH